MGKVFLDMRKKWHNPVLLFLFLLGTFSAAGIRAQSTQYPPPKQVAHDFRALVQKTKTDFNISTPVITTDAVFIEKRFITYRGKAEKIPLVIYKPLDAAEKRLPVVICLHGTGGSKDASDVKNILYRLTKAGFIGVAIDARYHGERVGDGVNDSKAYVEAITRAWKNTDTAHQEHPFFFDTVADIWTLIDYLTLRPDIDATRIGMTGISMGGIETWMAASVDTRVKVIVPIIAAQSFQWSLGNDRWQGRAHTIWAAHRQAAADLGDTAVNKQNVKAVWDKLLPGITGEFDCPSMLRLFAPRPLLILSNEKDENCPLPGAQIAFAEAKQAYQEKGAADKLEMVVSPNEPHRLLPGHVKRMIEFFSKWL